MSNEPGRPSTRPDFRLLDSAGGGTWGAIAHPTSGAGGRDKTLSAKSLMRRSFARAPKMRCSGHGRPPRWAPRWHRNGKSMRRFWQMSSAEKLALWNVNCVLKLQHLS
jgi:hypothetical protein